MIRRHSPLGSGSPEHWLLIPQREHALLSHALAAAWGNDRFAPLVCDPSDEAHPLAGVRREFLAALLHHDDGWAAWWDSPGVDPASGAPYAFTEMPPADAQRLWDASIDACRREGPLAGWVVATHFSALQSKRDHDWPEWRGWIERVDGVRVGWLEEWRALSDAHTSSLAERCLGWLQAFDWMSLWLCLHAPQSGEAPEAIEPMAIDAVDATAVVFEPVGGAVAARPWPFGAERLRLAAAARRLPTGRVYDGPAGVLAASEETRVEFAVRP